MSRTHSSFYVKSHSASSKGGGAEHKGGMMHKAEGPPKLLDPAITDPAKPPTFTPPERREADAESIVSDMTKKMTSAVTSFATGKGRLASFSSTLFHEITAAFFITYPVIIAEGWFMSTATLEAYYYRALIISIVYTLYRVVFKRAYVDMTMHFGYLFIDASYGHIPRSMFWPRVVVWFLQSGFSFTSSVAASFAAVYTLRNAGNNFNPNSSLQHQYGVTFLSTFVFYASMFSIFCNSYEHMHSARSSYDLLKAYQSRSFNQPLYHLQEDGDIYVHPAFRDSGAIVPRSGHHGMLGIHAYADHKNRHIHAWTGLAYFVGIFLSSLISGSFLNINITLAFNAMQADYGGNWFYDWLAMLFGVAFGVLFMLYKGYRHHEYLKVNAVIIALAERHPEWFGSASGMQLVKLNLDDAHNVFERMQQSEALEQNQKGARDLAAYQAWLFAQQRGGSGGGLIPDPNASKLANSVIGSQAALSGYLGPGVPTKGGPVAPLGHEPFVSGGMVYPPGNTPFSYEPQPPQNPPPLQQPLVNVAL